MFTTHRPELIPADQFIKRVARDIDKASSHIWVMSMIVNEDDSTRPFFDALIAASQRGIDVRFAADTFTFTELSGRTSLSETFINRLTGVTRLRKKLRATKIDFHWLGGYTYTFFTGRTHMKWIVIDDIVYSFGGINLYDLGLKSADFLLRVKDKKLARELADEHLKIVNANYREYSYRSHSLHSQFGDILIDGGLIGDSLIYRRACILAKQAERIICVSQYCPTGKFAKLLRQRSTQLYYSSDKNASLMNRVVIWLGAWSSGLASIYTRERYIHAKYAIFYMADGSRVAITGSHNFVREGAMLGTKEIALETRDKHIIDQLEAYTASDIA